MAEWCTGTAHHLLRKLWPHDLPAGTAAGCVPPPGVPPPAPPPPCPCAPGPAAQTETDGEARRCMPQPGAPPCRPCFRTQHPAPSTSQPASQSRRWQHATFCMCCRQRRAHLLLECHRVIEQAAQLLVLHIVVLHRRPCHVLHLAAQPRPLRHHSWRTRWRDSVQQFNSSVCTKEWTQTEAGSAPAPPPTPSAARLSPPDISSEDPRRFTPPNTHSPTHRPALPDAWHPSRAPPPQTSCAPATARHRRRSFRLPGPSSIIPSMTPQQIRHTI